MKSNVRISGNTLQVTRIFDAPRNLVFSWWTTADKLRQWFGCKETVKCDVVMDFRVGGSFTQRMQIEVDGGTCEFTVSGEYEEILVPEKIVYRANFGPSAARVTVEFHDHGSGTKISVTHRGLPDESSRRNVSQGTLESLDKLEALLSGQTLLTSF
jgi:uncharacterized protein YndB with AHSA1/START domain